jgi:hypothetical protein
MPRLCAQLPYLNEQIPGDYPAKPRLCLQISTEKVDDNPLRFVGFG